MKIAMTTSAGLLCAILCGCAHVRPGVSSMSFVPGAMDVIGPATGESTDTFILYFIPIRGDAASIVEATNNAVKSVGADALINTVVDDEEGKGILYSWQTIRVHGTAVKFKAKTASRMNSDAHDAPTENRDAAKMSPDELDRYLNRGRK